jgi:hypothetical protein
MTLESRLPVVQDLAADGDREFESISLQRRVLREPEGEHELARRVSMVRLSLQDRDAQNLAQPARRTPFIL